MSRKLEIGEPLFIPFRNGKSLTDSQLRPRIYKSVEQLEKNVCKDDCVILEYAPIIRGEWVKPNKEDFAECSECGCTGFIHDDNYYLTQYCPHCGAKMENLMNIKNIFK